MIPTAQKNSRGCAPGLNKKQRANHRLAGRITQPPFARTALDRMPKFFAPVVHLGDWNAAFADPRPAVLIPENADVLDFEWRRIFRATTSRAGLKVIVVEAGRSSGDRIKSVAASLMAVGFGRVVVVSDGSFPEDGSPIRVYGEGIA